MEYQIDIRSLAEVTAFIQINNLQNNPAAVLLLGGDRLTCCDKTAIAIINGKTVGVVTVSYQGESQDGTPTIVGAYVLKSYRGQGIGKAMLLAAIDFMQRKRLKTPYRIDTVSKAGQALVLSLPKETLDLIQLNHLGNLLDMFPE